MAISPPPVIDTRRLDGVLFDLDGVLTDTAVVHAAAWRTMFDAVLARRAVHPDEDHSPFGDADYRHHIDGKPRLDGIRAFLAARRITLPEGSPTDITDDTVYGLAARKQQLFLQRLERGVAPIESTIALLHRLRSAGMAVAVYSASRNCRRVLNSAGIEDLFAVRVDGIDAAELGLPGKPDPAMLWEAARRLGLRPARCAVIEDAEAGVTAARRGEFGFVIGLDRSGVATPALLACGADLVVPDLARMQVHNGFAGTDELPDAVACLDEIVTTLAGRTPTLAIDAPVAPEAAVLTRLAALFPVTVVGEPPSLPPGIRVATAVSDCLDNRGDQGGDGAPPLPIYLGAGPDAEDGFDLIHYHGIGIAVAGAGRRTAARFTVSDTGRAADLLIRLADRLDVDSVEPGDPWVMTFDGYHRDSEQLRETLCTVGNGRMATRGCAPEAFEADTGVHYPGTYCAGVFNRLYDTVAGREIDNESMVNLPNWLPLTFRIDGESWFDIDAAEILSYRQSMNLRCAELVRELRVRDHRGRITRLVQRRLAAMHDPQLAALQFLVTPENYSGTLEFRSFVDSGVRNRGVARYARLSDRHLEVADTGDLGEDAVLAVVQTVQSTVRIAVGMRTCCWLGDTPAPVTRRGLHTDTRIGHDLALAVEPGRTVTVEKTVVIVTGHDPGVSEPADTVRRRLDTPPMRYHAVRNAHRNAWNRLWDQLDITLDGRTDENRVLRFHLMHLIQTVSPHTADVDAGVPARGLHGEAYRGHIFWDELFVFPVLNLRLPAVTKALLSYRYRRLPEARRAATQRGLRGAMFPWQSGSDGREESQRVHLNPMSGRWNPDASARAHHIGLAVAYNAWQYYSATADTDYLADQGAELIIDIARFWVSLAQFEPDRGRYVIRGVIGPDEFHSGYPDRPYDGIDNNAYTNVMAAWVITRALTILQSLSLRHRLALLDRLGLSDDELARFDDVSRRMFVPFHDGVISQFEGYEQLAELDWNDYRQRYGDIARLDRILESENDDVNRYRAAKQADVLMLLYLLSSDELRELLDRMGYPIAPEQIPRTVEYYLHRTSHGSTLSAVVHSWVLIRGHRDTALSFFTDVLRADIDDVQGGTTAEGIHLAAMAGSVDLVQRGFTGLELRDDRLVLNPRWPRSLGELAFPLQYRGHRLHVRIIDGRAEVSSDSGAAAPVSIQVNRRTRLLAAGSTARFD